MSRVDGVIKSLLQGVSQQPAKTRLPGQCTLQENASSDPVKGLTRRPPLEVVKNLNIGDDNASYYYQDLGDDKEFIVAVTNLDIHVFDMLGNPKTVTKEPGATNYLSTAGTKFLFSTLENTTYIVNPKVVVTMNAASAYAQERYGYIYALGGQYGRTYTVNVNWKEGTTSYQAAFSYTTPDGSTASHINQIAPNYIIQQLTTNGNALGTNGFATKFQLVNSGEVIMMYPETGSPVTEYSISALDSEAGTHLKTVKGSVDSQAFLPRFANDGAIVRIEGDKASGADDWYVKFEMDIAGSPFGSSGTWVETAKPGIKNELSVNTMPHLLEYDPDTDSFTFKRGEWKGRQVGDEDTNPNPSFVGRTIEFVSYFQGRLVLLSGPAVLMSRQDRPLDFWIETATAVTDSDAIDMESTALGVSKMFTAVPHNRDLIIFSDGGQFIIFGRTALTPQNASLVLTTSFEANLTAPPVSAGKNIFFAIDYGNWGGIREFYSEGSEDTNDARLITQHVLKYIEGPVQKMAATTNFNMLLVQASNKRHLYVYEYIWLDQTKAQSSWSKWIFEHPVQQTFFVGSRVYVIYRSETGDDILAFMDLDVQSDAGADYPVYLDYKMTVDNVNLTVDCPLPGNQNYDNLVVIQGEGCPVPGMQVPVLSRSGTTLTLRDDMEGGTVIIGKRFMMRYKPTIPVIKGADGSTIGTGQLTISKFLVNTSDTGVVETKVTSKYKADTLIRFIGRYVGNPSSVIGKEAIVSTTLTVPFRDKSAEAELEIFTDHYTPLTIMDIEWLGQYTKRGNRVSSGE